MAWSMLRPLVVTDEGSCLLPGTVYDTGRGYPAFRLGDGPGAGRSTSDPASRWPTARRAGLICGSPR